MNVVYLLLCFFIVSCSTTVPTVINEVLVPEVSTPIVETETQKSLNLTFAGDIMAHTVNYQMNNYNLIYNDITPLLHADDVSFANFETPVVDTLPYESYPTFNVQSEYALAAINGGFDAFSLANNHTNDQGIEGIISTKAFFDSVRPNGVYSAGIKSDDNLSYDIINVKDYKILFVAITEIVNLYAQVDAFDVYSPSEKRRSDLKNDIVALQNEQEHDIFVLSVHTQDPEYDTSVSENRRKWFYELLDAGVDIVWGNHPHVTKEWELIKSDKGDKIIMYSIGNTISGQNYILNYENPLAPRENTGTSIFMQVSIQNKNTSSDVVLQMNANPVIITSYRDEQNNVTIKQLTEEFISTLNEKNRDYYTVRLQDMEQITGTTTWQ